MTYSQEQIDAFLAHHGVKGMHWGVRRDRSGTSSTVESRRKELAKINKQISKVDGQKVVDGLELRGSVLKKQYKKEVKKNPDFAYRKLSTEQKEAYQKAASRKVTGQVIKRGVFETAVVLGGGTLAVSKIHASQEAKIGAEISVIMLAGQIGKTRVDQLQALHAASKLDELHKRRAALGGTPK